MDAAVLGKVLTLGLFGGLGVFLAGRVKLPVTVGTWALIVAAALAAPFVGPSTALVSIFGVSLLLNWAITSCCLGVLAGLLARRSFRPAS